MSDNNSSDGFLKLLAGLYLASTQVMTVYFWWQMAREDSFISCITIDPILAELKGLVWPFFI